MSCDTSYEAIMRDERFISANCKHFTYKVVPYLNGMKESFPYCKTKHCITSREKCLPCIEKRQRRKKK